MRQAMVLLMIAAIWCTLTGGGGAQVSRQATLTLLDKVEVSGQTILLSDVLPLDAPEDLRREASQISFGLSPLPGSLRVLAREEVVRQLARLPRDMASMVVPREITVKRSTRELDSTTLEAAIAGYLELHGWTASDIPEGAWLQTSARLSGSDPAELRVEAMEWDAARSRWRFSVRCADGKQCGRFVTWAQLPPQPASLREVHRQPPAAKIAEPALIRPGERAMLLLELDGMRISMPVVCLEAGARQQKIRVRDLKNRRIFLAEVIADKQLRAAF